MAACSVDFWEALKTYSEMYLGKQVHDLAKSILKKRQKRGLKY